MVLVPRKGTAKMEKDVWGKRCPSQRMASKAVLDIPITKAKGYQGSRTVMMIKGLLNKLCQSLTSARRRRQQEPEEACETDGNI